ncbi:MAG TPA: CotH kinase family protein [Pirellulales bacterium]|nr:CotH kinase family protein [Pirellulales bacterium]
MSRSYASRFPSPCKAWRARQNSKRLSRFERLEVRLQLAAGSVVINEINYNPPDKTKPTEFIELTNPGTTAVDLSGASFVNGVHYTFPSGTTLAAGGFIVVSESPTALQQMYGVSSFGPWTGSLSNSGEDVTIQDAAGNTLDDVNYGVGFPWPIVGDSPGPGYSIELINPNLDNNLGGNWRSYNPAVTTQVTLISKDSTWDYRKGTAEATPSPYAISAWRGLDYVEDSNWKTGTGPIGYDQAGGPTMGTTLSDMNGSYTSVFMRKTFYIPDPAEALGLTLQAMYDDGFNVWINGHLAQTVNTPGENTAFNGLASSARAGSDATYYSFTINPTFLQAGDNEIAIQFFNAAKTDSDAYFDAALIETTGTGGPTPGRQNSDYAAAAAPDMRQVTQSQQMPTPGTTQTITVKVTDPAGVAAVTLSYQTVDAGNYISLQDSAYSNPVNWTTVTMFDDGTNGDATAGDGIYTAVLPASVQVDRRLVRYRITATGNDGLSITGPYDDDPVPNFAYYVYSGVPSYTAALDPGASGSSGQTQTFSSATMSSVPVLQLLTKQQDHDNSQHIPGSNTPASTGNEYAFSGTLVYNGVVYDGIHYRARGGVWRYAMGKNMWKIDFENGHDFQAYYADGTPYPTTWKKLDLGADIQQGDIGDRGEQGLFETMSFALFNEAGVPAPGTIPTELRIVENSSATGTSQYTTDFQGLYLMVEEPDGHFLDSHDLPDGNLYKIENGAGTSKNQGPTEPSDGSDLTAFINALNNHPSEAWIEANIDLPEFYAYQAVTEMIHNWDIGFGKNYLYYHNPDTGLWEIIPWDTDLTWYVNYQPTNGDITPFTSAILAYLSLQIQYRDTVRSLEDLLFSPENISKLADTYANEVNPSGAGPTLVQADAAMWDYNPIETSSDVNSSKAGVGRYYANGSPTQDFAGMVARLKSFEQSRISYLDSTVITTADAAAAPLTATVTYTGDADFPLDDLTFSTGSFAAGNLGGTFAGVEWRIADVTNVSGLDPNLEVNAVWDSGVITTYSPTITIPSNIGLIPGHTYRVRVRMLDSNGRWSHWSSVNAGSTQFVVTAPNNAVKNSLRITELNYDPAKPPKGSPYNNDDFEFVELENFGSQTLNLAGVSFTNGIDYTFGNVTLAPGQVGVLVHNTAAFQSLYGTGPLILGDYLSTGQSFSNSGEEVELDDAFGQVLADFTYSPNWYSTTHGSGSTLEVINPAVDPDLNNSANWRASTTTNGTPGVGSTVSLPAPTGAAATNVSTTQVSLQWIDNAMTEQGYTIFRSTAGGPFTQIASLAANSTTFTDNNSGAGLIPGEQYEYLIQAFNASGFSNPGDVVVTTLSPAPTNLVGLPGSGAITLTWSVPVGAVTYNVYRGFTSGGEGVTPIATNLALPSYADASISGNNYYYVITAVNTAGLESARSAEIGELLGPVDWYQFDAGSGTTGVDSAGTDTGTLVGTTKPAWVAGRIGPFALSFSGDGQYEKSNESAVQVASNLAPILGSTSTLDVWVKTTQTGNNIHYMAPAITGVEESGGTNDINWGTLNAAGDIGIYVGDTGGVYSTSAINNGQWHNIAMTRDVSTGIVQLYVDGVLQGTSTFDTGSKTSQFFLIGALTDVASNGTTINGANYFNGSLDDVRIYSRVLSASEIAGLGEVPATPTGCSATALSASQVQLNWTNASNFAQNIEIDRKTGSGGTFAQVALLQGSETTFTDTNLTAGAQYFYQIRALDGAGNSAFTSAVNVTPPVPTVASNFIFYNDSFFDDELDSNAIATDKQVLLPGQTASFESYTSYSKGLNGLMIDVNNLDGNVTSADFTFLVGNSSDVTSWQAAPAPQIISEFPGGGVNGSTRIEIIWADNAIQNQWLQVTLLADAVTQLATPDVFYVGNAMGDVGNSTTDANVDSTDILGARGHHDAGPVSVINPYDFNRDGIVDSQDVAIAKQNVRVATAALQLITAPSSGGGSLSAEAVVASPIETSPQESFSDPVSMMVMPISLPLLPAPQSASPVDVISTHHLVMPLANRPTVNSIFTQKVHGGSAATPLTSSHHLLLDSQFADSGSDSLVHKKSHKFDANSAGVDRLYESFAANLATSWREFFER